MGLAPTRPYEPWILSPRSLLIPSPADKWSNEIGLNYRPHPYQGCVLPTELSFDIQDTVSNSFNSINYTHFCAAGFAPTSLDFQSIFTLKALLYVSFKKIKGNIPFKGWTRKLISPFLIRNVGGGDVAWTHIERLCRSFPSQFGTHRQEMIVYDWNYTNILMTLTSYHNTLLFGTHRQNIIWSGWVVTLHCPLFPKQEFYFYTTPR